MALLIPGYPHRPDDYPVLEPGEKDYYIAEYYDAPNDMHLPLFPEGSWFGSLAKAMKACEDHAGHPLDWKHVAPLMWGVYVPPETEPMYSIEVDH